MTHTSDYHPLAGRTQRRRNAWDPWPEVFEWMVVGMIRGIAGAWKCVVKLLGGIMRNYLSMAGMLLLVACLGAVSATQPASTTTAPTADEIELRTRELSAATTQLAALKELAIRNYLASAEYADLTSRMAEKERAKKDGSLDQRMAAAHDWLALKMQREAGKKNSWAQDPKAVALEEQTTRLSEQIRAMMKLRTMISVKRDRAADQEELLQSATIGDIRVEVVKAAVGSVALDNLGHAAPSQDSYLWLRVRITNLSETRKIGYKTWMGDILNLSRNVAVASDDLGNTYRRINFGIFTKVVGQQDDESIYPKKSLTDMLVFELPVDAANQITVSLPAANFGEQGAITFHVDVSYRRSR